MIKSIVTLSYKALFQLELLTTSEKQRNINYGQIRLLNYRTYSEPHYKKNSSIS